MNCGPCSGNAGTTVASVTVDKMMRCNRGGVGARGFERHSYKANICAGRSKRGSVPVDLAAQLLLRRTRRPLSVLLGRRAEPRAARRARCRCGQLARGRGLAAGVRRGRGGVVALGAGCAGLDAAGRSAAPSSSESSGALSGSAVSSSFPGAEAEASGATVAGGADAAAPAGTCAGGAAVGGRGGGSTGSSGFPDVPEPHGTTDQGEADVAGPAEASARSSVADRGALPPGSQVVRLAASPARTRTPGTPHWSRRLRRAAASAAAAAAVIHSGVPEWSGGAVGSGCAGAEASAESVRSRALGVRFHSSSNSSMPRQRPCHPAGCESLVARPSPTARPTTRPAGRACGRARCPTGPTQRMPPPVSAV